MELSCSDGCIVVFGTFKDVSEQGRAAKTRRVESCAGKAAVVITAEEAGGDLDQRRAALRQAKEQRENESRLAAAEEETKRHAAQQLAFEKQEAAAAAGKAAAAEKESKKQKQHEKQQRNMQSSEEDARKTLGSGLKFDVLGSGSGSTAKQGSLVSVHYEGRLAKTGRHFDKGSIRFRLGRGEVIAGWDQGILGMRVGEQRRLMVPSHLGYGKRGSPPKIPPGANLVFTVILNQCS